MMNNRTYQPGPVTTAPPPSRALRLRAAAADSGPDLWDLKPTKIWAWLKTQPVAFWGLCVYLIFEYLHPQIIYPVINVLPWGYATKVFATIALLMTGKSIAFRTVIGGGLVFYSVVVLLSSVTAWSPAASWARYEFYFTWVWVFLLITNIVRTEKQFFVFMLLYMLCSFKMSLFGARTWAERGFAFADWGATGSPVWFHNSGEFGVQMAIFFPIAVYAYIALRKHLGKWSKLLLLSFPVTAVMSMIASSSRGALVGGGLVLIWMVARTRYRFRAAIGAAVVVALVVFATPPEFKQRFAEAGEDDTSQARLEVWANGLEMAEKYPVLGIGFGNWSPYSTVHYGRPLLPHNVFIEALGEMGYMGLSAFLLLIVATFVVNYRTRRIAERLPGDRSFSYQMAFGLDGALLGFIGSGFFVTVLYYPFFWINLALTVALHVSTQDTASKLARTGVTRLPTPVLASPTARVSGRGRMVSRQ